MPKEELLHVRFEHREALQSKKEYEQRYKQWLENQHKLFIKLREIGRAKATDNAFDFIRFTKEFMGLIIFLEDSKYFLILILILFFTLYEFFTNIFIAGQ